MITGKVQPHLLSKQAYVYLRQSTMGQVRFHQESTQRQYALQDKAQQMGWSQASIKVLVILQLILLFEEEWKILYSKIYKTKTYLDNVPTIKEVIRLIAQIGGFLGRKNDGDPGPITLWRSWKRLSDLVEGSYLSTSTHICG